MEHECDIHIQKPPSYTGSHFSNIGIETGRHWNKGRIIENGQNAEKFPVNIWRLGGTQTLNEKPSANTEKLSGVK